MPQPAQSILSSSREDQHVGRHQLRHGEPEQQTRAGAEAPTELLKIFQTMFQGSFWSMFIALSIIMRAYNNEIIGNLLRTTFPDFHT
jgi:hypothetical protein